MSVYRGDDEARQCLLDETIRENERLRSENQALAAANILFEKENARLIEHIRRDANCAPALIWDEDEFRKVAVVPEAYAEKVVDKVSRFYRRLLFVSLTVALAVNLLMLSHLL